jgi:hypothetical protein
MISFLCSAPFPMLILIQPPEAILWVTSWRRHVCREVFSGLSLAYVQVSGTVDFMGSLQPTVGL